MSGAASTAGRMRANIRSSIGGLSRSAAAARVISASSSFLIGPNDCWALRRAISHFLPVNRLDIAPHLCPIRLAQADNPYVAAAPRESHCVETHSDEAEGDLA